MDSSKKRTVYFSAKEVGILMSLALKFKNTIECKKTDKMNNDLKQKTWEQLTNEYNSICGETFRCAKVLRGKYENQKKRSKQKFADEKTYFRGTGGGPVKPKIFDDIDEKVKDIIGTQMTGFDSEFDGDSNVKVVLEENLKDSEEEDNTFSELASKRRKIMLSQDTCTTSTTSCSTVSPTDWSKMTPDKLKTPKSKQLKTILKAASGKGEADILSSKVTLWATNKAEIASQQKEFLEKEHLLRMEMMKEQHKHQMALDTKESDERLLIQAKKAELELAILQLQKEQQLNKNIYHL